MAASKLDILIEQGADYVQKYQLQDSDGNPIDLTGATISAQIRWSYSQPNPPIATFVNTITDAPNGKFSLSLVASTTLALPVNPAPPGADAQTTDYLWDLNMTKAGVVTKLLYGTASIYPEVTK